MDLKGDITRMHELALSSKSRAYCPYSRFSVGSCILGANGKYYTGCNVENAISPFCAERTAIVKMVQDGCKQLLEVYVITDLSDDLLAAPCGYCRQMIKQFSDDDQKVLIHLGSTSKGYESTFKLVELLPKGFGPKSLGKTSSKDYVQQ